MEWYIYLGLAWLCLGLIMLGIFSELIDNVFDVIIVIGGAPIWFLMWLGKKIDGR